MKLVLSLAFSLMLSAPTLFAQDGVWRIEHAELPDGKSYNGSLTINRLGKSYDVNWRTTAGNYNGLGLFVDGKLFVGYGVSGGYGIVIYKTNTAGRQIEGVWTASGMNGAMGTEILTEREGLYEVSGTNPDGGVYRGTLTLQKTGDTFQAQWQVANQTINGVGFMSGDYMVIGYGPGQSFGTVEYAMAGNKARGRWAMGGGSQFGIENIMR
ncbi:hypothetical protein GCM10028805_31020 [Spirosoma harenae]